MAKPQKNRDESSTTNSNIVMSRTTIPKPYPHFILRSHLFPLLEATAPASTLIVAPAGFGKTTLVAQWAIQKENLIWLTLGDDDSLEEMSAMFIQATRNLLPGFASWFETSNPIRPTEIVKRWGEDLSKLAHNFIFVLDYTLLKQATDSDLSMKLIAQFPTNVHLVVIRRQPSAEHYATYASRGSLNFIGINELRLTDEELKTIANSNGLDLSNSEILRTLQAADGWPAAVTHIIFLLRKYQNTVDLQSVLSSQAEPLAALAKLIVKSLEPKVKKLVSSLALVTVFDNDIAKVILEKDFDENAILNLSTEGLIFTKSIHSGFTFTFNEVMREAIIRESNLIPSAKQKIHFNLSVFFENRGQLYFALQHAILASSTERISELFPNAARVLMATGRGKELIKLSQYAGDASDTGYLLRGTVLLSGHLSNLDFQLAVQLMDELILKARSNPLEGFIKQIVFNAKTFIDFSNGNFDELEKNLEPVLTDSGIGLNIGNDEILSNYRLMAGYYYFLESSFEIERILNKATKLVLNSPIPNSHLQVLAINSLALFSQGEYRKAYESATVALQVFRKEGHVGIVGPLDILMILARCELEFARPEQAKRLLEEVSDLAEKWRQWPWHIVAEGLLARELVLERRKPEAFKKIADLRTKVTEIKFTNNLNQIVDAGELITRFAAGDFERVDILLDRSINLRSTEQIRQVRQLAKTGITSKSLISSLPTDTPRERLWRQLNVVDLVIDQERKAIVEMKLALQIGSEIGAKETFLRQNSKMTNLILKVAAEVHTVYLEDLSNSVLDRIRLGNLQDRTVSLNLTKRELEVLRHLSTERPISSIARDLHISENTMKTHLKNLYRKMEVAGRQSAVEKAHSLAII